MITIHNILQQIRDIQTSEQDKGARFEELIRQYLSHDPLYSEQFSDVWRWMDWPGRDGQPDTGIDLVAERRDGSGNVAIQCKCYGEDDTIQKSDIDSFLAASGKKEQFVGRIIVSSTPHWSKHAEEQIHGQFPPVQRIDLNDLEASTIDWSIYDINEPGKVKQRERKKLRDHQKDALKKVEAGFEATDRGQMIMACGTGKTFTSLKIAEKMAGRGKRVLFLVPSLSLLSQTLREWTAESSIPLHCYAVCSDVKIGKHDDSEPTTPDDLALPATTDAKALAEAMLSSEQPDKMTVVFSTYQSIEIVSKAQKKGVSEFDLIICDEAHRTTGAKLESAEESQFVRVHDANFIKAKKRLYMTATPRLYSSESKAKAAENEITVWSMDDETMYGPVFYKLGFSEAVNRSLLCDYKVIVLAVSEEHVNRSIQRQLENQHSELNLDDAVKIIGCWNGLSRKFLSNGVENGKTSRKNKAAPMRRAVAFTTTIKNSKLFRDRFKTIVEEYLKAQPEDKNALICEVEHVDGKTNALERNKKLVWLKEDTSDRKNYCRVLTNAKCLSEGVDVPALDAVMFLNPRKSKVDVVQSVGRVMRKVEGKEYGYIILPIGIPADKTPEEALNDNEKYRIVWDVLQALRAHDDRFNIMINQLDLNKQRPDNIQIIGVGGSGGDSDGDGSGEMSGDVGKIETQQFLKFEDIENWKNAIFGKIVVKCGEKRYWEQWAKDVADIATKQIDSIKRFLADDEHALQFESFLAGLRLDLSQNLSEDEAIEMLSQHLITKPVFDALFGESEFTRQNPVSREMDKMTGLLEDVSVESNLSSLADFYESVRKRATGIDNAYGKQKIIIELYDKFFKTAFPRMAERLGIVYTPVEVVDFIIHSVDAALKKQFKSGIGAKDVHILDPFTGTGTFIVRLLQSGLIASKDLRRKYVEELHANEIVLLAYYIAAVNIEETYHEVIRELTGKRDVYLPFEGIVLTDTFLMTDEDGTFEQTQEELNNRSRANRQRKTPIRVIIGNPPYSAGQRNANDNNQNIAYPKLSKRIAETYAEASTAVLKSSLYDSYIRAIRWASDRIGDKGILCYVSNGSYIDGNAMDGVRKSFANEFSEIYSFNLRGNARTSGEHRRKEKGNVFGEGTRTPVAITLFIKNPTRKNKSCAIHYHDIGDYLDQNEKLATIKHFGSIENVPWQTITPNDKHDWINQRDDVFDTLLSLGDKKDDRAETIFGSYSRGLATARDAWVYNFSKQKLSENMERTIKFYNEQVETYKKRKEWDNDAAIRDVVTFDSTFFAWGGESLHDAERGVRYTFDSTRIYNGAYRPFCKMQVYHDTQVTHRAYQMPKIFPEPGMENLTICLESPGGKADFSALITNILPDLHLFGASQCFPFYTYEPIDKTVKKSLIAEDMDGEIVGDYIRRENITDATLQKFREHYKDSKITKEDIFYYIYGVLNCRTYQERFAAELKKQLPRVPFVKNFKGFNEAGRKLAELHLNYETLPEYPLVEHWAGTKRDYTVTEKGMKFPSKQDKSQIIYNASLTLTGIPRKTCSYIVNGKSALEWIMERYKITTHKDSGIVNDPNDWCEEHDDEKYILNLVKRIVYLSVESVRIIEGLPELAY